MKNGTARRFFNSMVVSLVATPVATVVLGEAFTHSFNIMLDEGLGRRMLFTFQKPMIFGLVGVMLVILVASLRGVLAPLFRWLAAPDAGDEAAYRAARRAALGIPWTLIIVTVAFWTAGTLAFFALNDWKSPGGTPLAWVLAFKITEGLMSATLNVLVINLLLLEPKKALRMERMLPGERDRFSESRDLIIMFSAMAAAVTHLAYVARYFVMRDPGARGPSDPVVSLAVVGSCLAAAALAMTLLSRREDRIQAALLRARIVELSSGGEADLEAHAPMLNFDAIGALADAFNGYTSTLRAMVRDIKTTMEGLASACDRLGSGTGGMKQALDEIASSVGGIGDTVEAEARSVEESTASIEAIGLNVRRLHEAIDEQAAMAAESGAGIEQMIGNIRSLSSSVEQVDAYYGGLTRAAGEGKRKLDEANALISRVSEMSGMLLDANRLIAAISAQTNLLAMNAAIEAAHAGEAGAGFSVVADEIRSLAEKSGSQSKDVAKRLREVKDSIDSAVTASADASRGFDEVASLIDTVSGREDEIRNALREQAEGSKQVLEAIGSMNGVTGRVKEGAREMGESAVSLAEGMRRLSELSSRVRAEMRRITGDVDRIGATFADVVAMVEANTGAIGRVTGQIGRFKA